MSSGIYFLNEDDFILRENAKGKLLGIKENFNGLTLLLFYSRECQFCEKLLSQFKQLPSLIMGCKFGMVNINQNPSVVNISKTTISPITYVPDLILYVNGLPYMRYDGPGEIENIKEFIVDIYQKLQKTSFLQNQNSQQQPSTTKNENQQNMNQPKIEDEIPAYSVGKPLCGTSKEAYGKCYLDFDDAYISSK